MIANWQKLGVALIAGIGVGLFAGLKIGTPKKVWEPPAPAIRQADGSLVLQRVIDPQAKPKQVIPKGGTVERVISATIQPYPTLKPHEDIKIDLSLVRMPDQTMRVVASSEQGLVVGGVDIPVQPSSKSLQLKHSAGISYGFNSYGAWYDRHYDRVTVGAEIRRTWDGFKVKGWDASIRVGLRF